MRLPGLLKRFAGATSRATVQTCSSAALCLSFRPSANMPHETTRLVRCWHCAGDKLDVLRETYAAALVCGSRNITVFGRPVRDADAPSHHRVVQLLQQSQDHGGGGGCPCSHS